MTACRRSTPSGRRGSAPCTRWSKPPRHPYSLAFLPFPVFNFSLVFCLVRSVIQNVHSLSLLVFCCGKGSSHITSRFSIEQLAAFYFIDQSLTPCYFTAGCWKNSSAPPLSIAKVLSCLPSYIPLFLFLFRFCGFF